MALRLLFILSASMILLVQNAYCSTIITAGVVNFGTYGNGNIIMELDTVVDEPSCPSKYIELPAATPIANYTLSIAALAFAAGHKIQIKTDGCFNGVPSLGVSRQSHILIKKP